MKLKLILLLLSVCLFSVAQNENKKKSKFLEQTEFEFGYKYKYKNKANIGLNLGLFRTKKYGAKLNFSYLTNLKKLKGDEFYSTGLQLLYGEDLPLECAFNFSNKDFEPTIGIKGEGGLMNIGYSFPYNQPVKIHIKQVTFGLNWQYSIYDLAEAVQISKDLIDELKGDKREEERPSYFTSPNLIFTPEIGFKYKYTRTLKLGGSMYFFKIDSEDDKHFSSNINYGGSLTASYLTNFKYNHIFSAGIRGNYRFVETSFNISNKDLEPTLGIYTKGMRVNFGYSFPYDKNQTNRLTFEVTTDNPDFFTVLGYILLLPFLGGGL